MIMPAAAPPTVPFDPSAEAERTPFRVLYFEAVNDLRCPSCSAPRDPDDNFCRRCGRQITVNLPAVRESSLPIESARGLPPSLVGSIAILAIGTGIEWLARRMASGAARGAARAAGRAIAKHQPAQTAPKKRAPDPAVVVREFVYMREVDLQG